jgi:hypothetical protein
VVERKKRRGAADAPTPAAPRAPLRPDGVIRALRTDESDQEIRQATGSYRSPKAPAFMGYRRGNNGYITEVSNGN